MTNKAPHDHDMEKGHKDEHGHTDFGHCDDNDHWGKHHNHGFCEKLSVSTYECLHATYMLIRNFFIDLCICFGVCWCPTKERLTDACDCCGKRYSQHTDAAFSTFEDW